MPIYRGAQKVIPLPGGVEAARVYRGDRLVYTSVVPSIYPVSGTWTGSPGFPAKVMASHTIAEAGTFTVTHSTTGSISPGIRRPGGETSASPGQAATWTGTISAGFLLEFVASGLASGTGTWTVTKH